MDTMISCKSYKQDSLPRGTNKTCNRRKTSFIDKMDLDKVTIIQVTF